MNQYASPNGLFLLKSDDKTLNIGENVPTTGKNNIYFQVQYPNVGPTLVTNSVFQTSYKVNISPIPKTAAGNFVFGQPDIYNEPLPKPIDETPTPDNNIILTNNITNNIDYSETDTEYIFTVKNTKKTIKIPKKSTEEQTQEMLSKYSLTQEDTMAILSTVFNTSLS